MVIAASEGGRALRLLKQREQVAMEAEQKKAQLEEDSKKRKFRAIDTFGSSQADVLEAAFSEQTVGLVTADEFRAKRDNMEQLLKEKAERDRVNSKNNKLKRTIKSAKLSFDDGEDDDDDDDDDDEIAVTMEPPKKRFGKDPTASTDFLPDREREMEREAKKMKLIQEYLAVEEEEKKKQIEITYSYWDGSGHRRQMEIEKGASISQFLFRCRQALEKEFPELRASDATQLMYIKEDLIIPQHITFHELIKNKARGKSGPLFHFDAHEDVRMVNDVRVEKDESHAGKIVDRKWYDRNKHIFPASRWEMYDPGKTYAVYTVHGNVDHSVSVKEAEKAKAAAAAAAVPLS